MEYINGVLKIPIRRRDYYFSEKDEIMFNGKCWIAISKHDIRGASPTIAKDKIKLLLKNGWIEFKENRKTIYSEVEIYQVTQPLTPQIKIGQEIYILGLGWGKKTKCWKKEIIDGEVIVFDPHGGMREEQSVINNSNGYMFSDKNKINEILSKSHMSTMIE